MIGHLLNRELTVFRPTGTADGAGGRTVTFNQLPDPIRVQVNQPKPEEVQQAQQWGARLSHIVHALHGSDVRRADELGGALPSDVPPGRRLRVKAVTSNSRETYWRLWCEVTQPEVGDNG